MEKLRAGQSVSVSASEQWNGLTSIEFANVLVDYVSKGQWIHGIRHVFGPDTNRADLAQALQSVLGFTGQIVDNHRVADQRLRTRHTDVLPSRIEGTLEERLSHFIDS